MGNGSCWLIAHASLQNFYLSDTTVLRNCGLLNLRCLAGSAAQQQHWVGSDFSWDLSCLQAESIVRQCWASSCCVQATPIGTGHVAHCITSSQVEMQLSFPVSKMSIILYIIMVVKSCIVELGVRTESTAELSELCRASCPCSQAYIVCLNSRELNFSVPFQPPFQQHTNRILLLPSYL